MGIFYVIRGIKSIFRLISNKKPTQESTCDLQRIKREMSIIMPTKQSILPKVMSRKKNSPSCLNNGKVEDNVIDSTTSKDDQSSETTYQGIDSTLSASEEPSHKLQNLGIFDEAKLIEWPSVQSASLQTFQVIAVIVLSTLVLQGINGLFNKISLS